jgi:hypothetical protein
MRNHHSRRNIFIRLTLNSIGALFSIIGLAFLFARSFGELAIPAIHLMTAIMYIPIATITIGVIGWVWAEYTGE